MINEITKDIAPGIIIEEGQLIQLPSGRLVKDFFQAVAMPETMGVMAGASITASATFGHSASPDNVTCWHIMALQ